VRSGANKRLDAPTEDLSGQHVGTSYRLTELIGSGATGVVWRALDVEHGVDKAVKLLHEELMREPKAVTRFVQERAILQMLRHPNIVRVHGLLTVGQSLGLVMDLVEGGSLRDHLRRCGTLPPSEAARLLAEVADALGEAHRNGVVHRDLKPDNILLDVAGSRPTTRLTDFGVARLLDTTGFTTSGAMVGTANYLAPETIYGGKATPAVDVYALGIVLYELLTGRPPYAGGPAWAILRRHVEQSPVPVPGLPPAAWRVIGACMDRRPGRRPTAEEVVVALRTLARTTAGLPALAPAAARAHRSSSLRGPASASGSAWGPLPAPGRQRPGTGQGLAPGRQPAGTGHDLPPGRQRTPTGQELVPARPHRKGGQDVGQDIGQEIVPVSGVAGRLPVPAQRDWRLHPRSTTFFVVVLAILATAFGVPVLKLIDGRARSTVDEPHGRPSPRVEAAAPSVVGSGAGSGAAAGGSAAPMKPPAALPLLSPAAQPGLKVRVGDPSSRPVEITAYGPWQCDGAEYQWDVGHPVLAKPCHANGGGVRLIGHLQALPGIQVDVTLSLVDAGTGEVLGGPFECKGLMFTDLAPSHDCGLFEVSPPHGRRLVVTETWQYTGRAVLPTGTVRGVEFDW
jgi:serine/threonine-protein kinase